MDESNHASRKNDFITVDELCEMFGVARITITGWIQSGELPHYRLGPRTIRIARADLDAFLADRRLTGVPGRLGDDGRIIDDEDAPTAGSRNAVDARNAAVGIRNRCSSPPEEVGDSRTAAA